MNQICDGKDVYRDKSVANKVCASGNLRGKHLNVFECPVCGYYHVGTAQGPQANRKNKGHYHRQRQRDESTYVMDSYDRKLKF